MLERALNALPVGVFYIDRDMRFQFVNRLAMRILQREDAGDVIGRTVLEVVGEEQFAILKPGIIGGLGGDLVKTEALLGERTFTSRFVPDLDEKGWVRGLFGLLSDITRQRTAEDALRASETEARRLALVASQTHNNVIISGADGMIEWVNRSFEKSTGFSLADVVGKRLGDVLGGVDSDRDQMQAMRDNALSGQTVRAEVALYNKLGQRYWALVEIQPIRDESGEIINYLTQHIDITAQKDAEMKLREAMAEADRNRDVLRAVLDAVPSPIVVKDDAHRYVEMNGAFTRFMGRPRELLLGRLDSEFLTDAQREAVHTQDEAVLSSGMMSVIEQQWLSPDNDTRWVLLYTSIGELPDGQRILVSNIADITATKATQAVLEETRSAAEAASLAKSEFLANMSHEIRTPMNGVLGMTELLLETPLSDPQSRYARNIYHSAESLLSVINDILDFSKIEAGRMELDPSEFDLRDMVETATELLATRAHAKGLELSAHVVEQLPPMAIGDAGRLRQVLVNLIGNAVKFTERGEVAISVTSAAVSPDPTVSQRVRFTVRDTGIGIPADAQRKLFTAFTQADGSTTRRFGGTGLGLAISRQLVELMGGEIQVESRAGEGSTFWFEVPLAFQAGTPREVNALALAGTRVLIVEDNPSNATILTTTVSQWGMRAECARTAEIALEWMIAALQSDPFRLVLCDMKLPGMSGIDLARQLKSLGMLPGAKLILVTSITSEAQLRDARVAGFRAVLAKPIRRGDLRNAVVDVLSPAAREIDDTGSTPNGEGSTGAPERAAASVRVLVAEDNPVNTLIASTLLKQLGHTVITAADGRAAVESYQIEPVDLVLMDCQMPHLDGYGATAAIRRIEASRGKLRVPIIAVTANALEGDRERCLEAGMDDYLAKPFKMATLRIMIDRWVCAPLAQAPSTIAKPIAVTSRRTGQFAIARTTHAMATIDWPSAHFDPSAFEVLKALQLSAAPGFVEHVLRTYVDTALGMIEKLLHNARAGSLDGCAKVAHALKAASRTVGARRLAELCAQLEAAATTGDGQTVGALADQIDVEFEVVRANLNRAIQTGTALIDYKIASPQFR